MGLCSLQHSVLSGRLVVNLFGSCPCPLEKRRVLFLKTQCFLHYHFVVIITALSNKTDLQQKQKNDNIVTSKYRHEAGGRASRA